VPSLIGSNAARLGELLVGPLLAGMGSPPPGRGAAWTEERGANPPFYDGDLTPATYRDWLRYNAVRYVALSTAPPDPAAAGEAGIIRTGQPWLIPVWRDRYWRLYLVTGTSPLASPPATVTGTTPALITLSMTRAGTTVVRVHWSRLLRADGAVVARDGPWTSLTARRPGRYGLSAPY